MKAMRFIKEHGEISRKEHVKLAAISPGMVFDAIGLTAAERKEVYWSIYELVKIRLDKAGSV